MLLNLEKIEWNEITYKEFVEYIKSLADEKYRQFHSSLVINSKYELIGIRTPIMRDIAKQIAKTNIDEFLKVAQEKYYEEVMIQGLVISHIKDEVKFNKYFQNHIKKIDNWALCDTFCSAIKIVEKYESKYFEEMLTLCLDKEEFISRVGIVTILDHFVKENYIQDIIKTLNKIKSDKFYINMAEAWLICEIYIKYPEQILPFIKNNKLNKFTHNKAISKIHDSFRVSKQDKEYLNTLKR